MLARLQTAIALSLLVLALTWLAFTVPAGRWGAAALGLLLLGGGHAVVLALECLLVAWLNRRDLAAPAATLRQWLQAWWAECLSAPRVFLWQQPFRSRRWPDLLPPRAEGRRGLLLVHGFVCNRGLWNDWLQRLTLQGVPFVAVDLEPVFGSIDDYQQRIDDGVARLFACTGLPPVVVAHSMGGLAVRRWRAGIGRSDRVHHLVTLGTPHRGTWLARWGFVRNTVQMRPHGAWLDTLRSAEAAKGLDHRSSTCFFSHCDNIVCPAGTATLPGADNRHLPATAHVHMVQHPAAWAEVQRLLASGGA
jgi:triacylglycerol lipase